MNPVKQFSPGDKWCNADGTLTERAKGFLRAFSDYTGAGAGTIPTSSLPQETELQSIIPAYVMRFGNDAMSLNDDYLSLV